MNNLPTEMNTGFFFWWFLALKFLGHYRFKTVYLSKSLKLE